MGICFLPIKTIKKSLLQDLIITLQHVNQFQQFLVHIKAGDHMFESMMQKLNLMNVMQICIEIDNIYVNL